MKDDFPLKEENIPSEEELNEMLNKLDPEKLIFMPPSDSSNYLESFDAAWVRKNADKPDKGEAGER